MEIFKINAWLKVKALQISLNTSNENQTAVFHFLYDNTITTITVNLDFAEKKFAVQSSDTLKSFACITICGVSVVGPIADCFRKAKDFDEFEECLKSQAMSITSSLLGCIAGCFITN